MKKTVTVFLIISLIFMLCSCGTIVTDENLWDNAVYTTDTELGTGQKTITVKVIVKDDFMNFTIKTDKEILGDVLTEHNLIAGEKGAYGLYVKKVNGIIADYDLNKSYWSLSKDGEYTNFGVDGAKINDGDKYELTYLSE